MYASFPTQYVTKPMHGHAFGLRIKTMLLVQCKLFYDYAKEFLITDYSKAFCIMLVYWENSHIFRGILYWPGIRYVRAKIELVGHLKGPATLQPLFRALKNNQDNLLCS